jgi:hypothetical protein
MPLIDTGKHRVLVERAKAFVTLHATDFHSN